MPELTHDMVRAMDQCAAATLVTLRRHFPREADWLYTTSVCRSFLDVLRDNPTMLDTIVDMFNSAVDAPVQMVRRTQ
jgi:hypothetical protein